MAVRAPNATMVAFEANVLRHRAGHRIAWQGPTQAGRGPEEPLTMEPSLFVFLCAIVTLFALGRDGRR
jgi:hypothetical protein